MLIVETGEKIPNSNTYVSLQEAFDYHSGLGNSDFTNDAPDYATFAAGDTSAQEAALVSEIGRAHV